MHVAPRPHTAEVRGERETGGVMAIPSEMEDNPLNEREVHHLTVHEEMDVGCSTSTEDEPIINVRVKGTGKPINVYPDAFCEENVGFSENPSTTEPSVSEKFLEQNATDPPDIQECRKRHHSPKMLKKVDAVDRPKYVSQEFSCQTGIKSSSNLSPSVKHPVPTKRIRPDSPMKKHEVMKLHEVRREKMKQKRQGDLNVQVNEAQAFMLLKKWTKEGVTLNGRLFKVHLTEVPLDKSYLEQHDFSPGTQKENEETTFVKKEAMATITEAAENQTHGVPVFVQANAEQYDVQANTEQYEDEKLQPSEPDGPLDLSNKGDQGVVVDDAGKGESAKIEEQELLHQEQPLDYSMQRDIIDQDMSTHPVAAYNEDCNNKVGATGPGIEDGHDDNEAYEEDDKEDEGADTAVEVANDNLPSLTAQAGNMSLASGNFEASMAQPQATQSDVIKQITSNLIKYLAAQRATQSQRRQASEIPTGLQQQQQQVVPQEQALGATVPNLNDLDMTEEDGRLKRNQRDVTKDSLQRLLANRNR